MDQGSVGDCGLFRLLMFERVSEISGVPATHTVPTLFPDQFLPGCELIPGPLFSWLAPARNYWGTIDQGSASSEDGSYKAV